MQFIQNWFVFTWFERSFISVVPCGAEHILLFENTVVNGDDDWDCDVAVDTNFKDDWRSIMSVNVKILQICNQRTKKHMTLCRWSLHPVPNPSFLPTISGGKKSGILTHGGGFGVYRSNSTFPVKFPNYQQQVGWSNWTAFACGVVKVPWVIREGMELWKTAKMSFNQKMWFTTIITIFLPH